MDQLLETIADVIASRVEARIKPLLVPDPTPQLILKTCPVDTCLLVSFLPIAIGHSGIVCCVSV